MGGGGVPFDLRLCALKPCFWERLSVRDFFPCFSFASVFHKWCGYLLPSLWFCYDESCTLCYSTGSLNPKIRELIISSCWTCELGTAVCVFVVCADGRIEGSISDVRWGRVREELKRTIFVFLSHWRRVASPVPFFFFVCLFCYNFDLFFVFFWAVQDSPSYP